MKQKITSRQEQILDILERNPSASISQIREMLNLDISIPSINRDLAKLVTLGFILREGKGRYTTYQVSSKYHFHKMIDTNAYFRVEPDKRKVFRHFNRHIFQLLENESVFTRTELDFFE